jgi:hypothetical protein
VRRRAMTSSASHRLRERRSRGCSQPTCTPSADTSLPAPQSSCACWPIAYPKVLYIDTPSSLQHSTAAPAICRPLLRDYSTLRSLLMQPGQPVPVSRHSGDRHATNVAALSSGS